MIDVRRRRVVAALVAASVAVTSAAARAEVPTASPPARSFAPLLPPGPLRLDRLRADLPTDLSLALGGALAWVITETLKPSLAPPGCRWCDNPVNGLDGGIRDAFRWSGTGTADTLSNVSGFVLTPLAAIGLEIVAAAHDGHLDHASTDIAVILEATMAAMDLDQAVKFAAGRERPFVHALPDAAKPLTTAPADNNVSFFSGHTTLVFSLVVSSGTVAWLRGYRWAPWVWSGLLLAVATGYLRMAADKHYFSDVAVGAAVGSLVGFGVPYLFHRRGGEASPLRPTIGAAASAGGGLISLRWTW